jgi:hypothetical protein
MMATPAACRRNISLNVRSKGALLSVTGTPDSWMAWFFLQAYGPRAAPGNS